MWPLLRNLFIAVILLSGVAVAFRDISSGIGTTAWTAAKPPAGPSSEDSVADGYATYGELEIAQGPQGHFRLEAEVNGESVDFLVDTGASIVVIGAETAARLGYDPDLLEYSSTAQTANGLAPIAHIILDEIVVGKLTVNAVEAAVIKAPMPTSLLGMSFLARLDGYEVREGSLVLRW